MEVRPAFDNPFRSRANEPGPQDGLSAAAKDRLSQSMAAKTKGLQGKGLNAKGMAGLMKMPGGMGGPGAELSNINQQVSSLSESLMGQTGSFVGGLQSSLNTTLTSLGNASTSLSEANDRLNRLLDMEGVMGQIPPQPIAPPAKAKPVQGKTNRERRQEIEQLDDTSSMSGDTPSAARLAGSGGAKNAAGKNTGVMPVGKTNTGNGTGAGMNPQQVTGAQMASQMMNQIAAVQQARFMSGGLNFKA
jgi:hypothetical protein